MKPWLTNALACLEARTESAHVNWDMATVYPEATVVIAADASASSANHQDRIVS